MRVEFRTRLITHTAHCCPPCRGFHSNQASCDQGHPSKGNLAQHATLVRSLRTSSSKGGQEQEARWQEMPEMGAFAGIVSAKYVVPHLPLLLPTPFPMQLPASFSRTSQHSPSPFSWQQLQVMRYVVVTSHAMVAATGAMPLPQTHVQAQWLPSAYMEWLPGDLIQRWLLCCLALKHRKLLSAHCDRFS